MHKPNDAGPAGLDRLLGLPERLGSRVNRAPLIPLALICAAIGVAKAGPAGTGPNFMVPLRSAAAALPAPENLISASTLSVGLMRLMQRLPDPAWWAVHGLLWLIVVATALHQTRRLGGWRSVGVLAVVSSSAFAATVCLLGFYDLYVVAGSLLVALGRRWYTVALGIVLAAGGNPDQALVSAAAFAVLGVALPGAGLRLRAAAYAGATVVWWLAVQAWFNAFGFHASRLNAVDPTGALLGTRLYLAAWPQATFAFFGALWVLVLGAFALVPRRSAIVAAAAVVGLPLLASLITLDGTRVFVCTSTAATAALLSYVWRTHLSDRPPPPWFVGCFALWVLLCPTIVLFPEPAGFLRLPYDHLLDVLGWVIDWTQRR